MKESGPAHGRPSSKSIPGPAHLRYYATHRIVAWQPHGVLDDRLLDEIADWLVLIEKVSLPFNRFVDFCRLTKISLEANHVFRIAQKRASDYRGSSPVRSALFCDNPVGFGIARLYESLMEEAPIEVRAFRDRAGAAEWLAVPESVLTLEDEPASRF